MRQKCTIMHTYTHSYGQTFLSRKSKIVRYFRISLSRRHIFEDTYNCTVNLLSIALLTPEPFYNTAMATGSPWALEICQSINAICLKKYEYIKGI